jgi:RNA ligase (TIGR02306 family)
MRQLATTQQIEEVRPIEGADLIAAYKIKGWWVVARLGEFEVGDYCTYIEIDSWIPTEVAPFLSKGNEPREYNKIRGERLKTIKLKGQISQGLTLPTTLRVVGEDVTDSLGITLWEATIPAQLAGLQKGNFPSFIPKTTQSRIQNLHRLPEGKLFEVTEKLHGTSCTIYSTDGEWGICSKDTEFKLDGNDKNTFVNTLQKLLHKLPLDGPDLAIQGEIIGYGINGNQYKIDGSRFLVFDIYNITTATYMLPEERLRYCHKNQLTHVPIIHKELSLEGETVESLLLTADTTSTLHTCKAEGLVFKSTTDDTSFKVISNKWLLKEK